MLAADRGVNNGSPSLHAKMLNDLAVEPGQHIAHIGAGTGYYTAMLAELTGAAGRVTAIEFDPALTGRARETRRSGARCWYSTPQWSLSSTRSKASRAG
jgi:protein-L-isoaspartate(D-aspartate) O-methyltransferase